MALQTPLHLAAQEGYTRVIERLIGYGADPNMTDVSGNTPLSDVIRNRGIIKTPSEDSPQTLQVLTIHVLTHTCGILYITVTITSAKICISRYTAREYNIYATFCYHSGKVLIRIIIHLIAIGSRIYTTCCYHNTIDIHLS